MVALFNEPERPAPRLYAEGEWWVREKDALAALNLARDLIRGKFCMCCMHSFADCLTKEGKMPSVVGSCEKKGCNNSATIGWAKGSEIPDLLCDEHQPKQKGT